MPEETPAPTTVSVPKMPKGSIGWYITFLILFILGVGLLYWKLDSDTRSLRMEITNVKAQMDADRVMIDGKLGEIKTEPAIREDAIMEEWLTYENAEYSIKYPIGFVIIPPTENIKWLRISNQDVSIEIWDADDLPERPIGFGEGTSEDDIDFGMPKLEGTLRFGKTNAKNVRIQYRSDDVQGAKDIYGILATVVIK